MSQEELENDLELDFEVLSIFVTRIIDLILARNMPSSSPASPIRSPILPRSPQNSRRPSIPQNPEISQVLQVANPAQPPSPRPNISTSTLHHCGQFTFYFPRCSHATCHWFHLNTWSGLLCSRNCVYERTFDYWFYADEGSLCSYCGLGPASGRLGPASGIGTLQNIPSEESGMAREQFFESLIQSGKLGGASGSEGKAEYESCHRRAVAQYNMLIDSIPHSSPSTNVPTFAQARTARRKRLLDRWDIRRFRARRRTDEWVNNIRAEQYDFTKTHVDVGSRPYIVTPTGNPYMDLYTEVPLPALPVPIDNCAWCQFSLDSQDAIADSGPPNSLPCGHTFHYNCIVELFEKRTRAKEKEVCKCPLCNTWFRDVREIPDFYGRYRSKEHVFDSSCESSVLSESYCGDLRGDREPPWLEEILVRESGAIHVVEPRAMVLDSEVASISLEDEIQGSESPLLTVDPAQRDEDMLDAARQPVVVDSANVSDRVLSGRDSGYESGSEHIRERQGSLQENMSAANGAAVSQNEQLSCMVTLRLPSPGIRRSPRQRRQPRIFVEEPTRVTRSGRMRRGRA